MHTVSGKRYKNSYFRINNRFLYTLPKMRGAKTLNLQYIIDFYVSHLRAIVYYYIKVFKIF